MNPRGKKPLKLRMIRRTMEEKTMSLKDEIAEHKHKWGGCLVKCCSVCGIPIKPNANGGYNALLPSLDFERVEECDHCDNGCITLNMNLNPNDFPSQETVKCKYCLGTGEIHSPLEFEDVPWNEILQELWSRNYTLKTKSGKRIVRREK